MNLSFYLFFLLCECCHGIPVNVRTAWSPQPVSRYVQHRATIHKRILVQLNVLEMVMSLWKWLFHPSQRIPVRQHRCLTGNILCSFLWCSIILGLLNFHRHRHWYSSCCNRRIVIHYMTQVFERGATTREQAWVVLEDDFVHVLVFAQLLQDFQRHLFVLFDERWKIDDRSVVGFGGGIVRRAQGHDQRFQEVLGLFWAFEELSDFVDVGNVHFGYAFCHWHSAGGVLQRFLPNNTRD